MAYSKQTEFNINLHPAGEDGAEFRFRNELGETQRQYIHQKDYAALTTTARLHRVHHGIFDEDDEDPATLLVIDFAFVGSRVGGHRFREAVIDVQFERRVQSKGSKPIDNENPQVKSISPLGFFAMNPSKMDESKTVSLELSGGATGGATPVSVNLGLGLGFERTTKMEKQANATIEGEIRHSKERTGGLPNVARWTLRENPQKEDGIVHNLRAAILVLPETQGPFEARVKIKTVVDWAHPIKKLFGQRVVDPVWFEAQGRRKDLATGEGLSGFDSKNMGNFNLESLSKVN